MLSSCTLYPVGLLNIVIYLSYYSYLLSAYGPIVHLFECHSFLS